jgi:hypothetical protein
MGIPASSGDFAKYYSAAVFPSLSVGYRFNPKYVLSLAADYGRFSIQNLAGFVYDKQYKLLVNAPPYTDLVGGGIQLFGFHADLQRSFALGTKFSLNAIAGLSLSFLEKSPVDGTDATGTYQILEHYVHEKPFGLKIGTSIQYVLAPSVSVQALLNYNALFTSYVTDKQMGYLCTGLGFVFKL